MKLTYWVARHTSDSDAYNIRTKTRREAMDRIADHWNDEDYEQPVKVTIEYEDGFDLMNQCMNEGRGYWEVG